MGGVQSSLPRPSLTCIHNINMTNRMTKKAALGGPSSGETSGLGRKPSSKGCLNSVEWNDGMDQKCGLKI